MRKLWIPAILAACFMLPRSAQAECEEQTQVSQLSDAWQRSLEAFAALDVEGLLTQSSVARAQILPCVGTMLTKRDAAAFHRLMAMEALVNTDDLRVVRELHASLLLEPSYEFPEEIVDATHPLRTLYEAAQTVPDGDGEKIYPPPGGWVMVGGVRNAARYAFTPVIIQVFTIDGVLRETRYVQPGESTPNWSGNAFGLTAADIGIDLDELRRPRMSRDPRPWFVASLAMAAASGVMYAIAMEQKGRYRDPLTPDDALAGLADRANTLGTMSLVTGGTALAFTGVGIGFQAKFGSVRQPKSNPHKEEPP